jgi:tape measure domain-containing protein
MAADDTTKLIISLELILRNLDRTLKGLSQVEKQLQRVASIKVGGTTNFDKAAASAQRLQQQQQKLSIQAQELANREERARQTTERLALARERLAQSTARQAAATNKAAAEVARINAATARQAARQEALRTLAAKTVADVQVREAQRGADVFVRSLEKQRQASEQFNKTVQAVGNSLRSIGQGLSTLGIGLTAALTAPLVALGVSSTQAAVSLDSLKRGLTAIVGSSAEAEKQLKRLTEIAKLPGIGFEEAIQGSIRLQAVGFSAAEAEKSLVQFANAIALTGGGRAELERVTVQLGQLAAKGKVLSQDLRPIIEAAPAVGRALLQAFGTVNADDIQELGLSSREFLNVLTSQLEKLPRAAAGARNAFENFRDTVFRASAAVGEALLPVLSRLIDVAAPVITRLAEAFRDLPRPLQSLIVVLGGFVAALGPVLFVFGQLTTGVGRLIVGFAQLSTVGLGEVIRNLRLLATGALAAAEAETTLAAANSLVAASLVGVGLAIAAAIAIYAAYKSSQKEAIQLSKDQVDAQEAVISGLEAQLKFLDGLASGVKRTSEEEQRLAEVYAGLNVQAQARVTGIADEEQRLAALRTELEKVLQLKQAEQVQGAANLAGSLANTLAQVTANEREIESNVRRVQANAALADSIRQSNTITAEQSRQLARQGINAATVEDALGALQAESESLVTTNQELRESTDGLNGTAKEQVATLATLEQQSGLTARQLLLAAKNMGVFRGDVEQTLVQLQAYTAETIKATDATRDFNAVLKEQSGDLVKAGDAAEEAEKRRKKLISSAAALAREASTTFDGALKFFRAFIAANPELSEAVRKQAQVQQKTIDEFLRETLGGRDKSGTALRNAQEQLQKAITAIVKAEGEKRVAEQEASNEELLRANESAFKQQLRSYREYLQTRAVLTNSALAKEAEAQGELVKQARLAQARLLKQATDQRLPAAERTRRQAQAKEAEAAAIEGERKLIEIQAKRKQLTDEVTFALAEAAVQQREDVRKLEVEFAKLQGAIESALNQEVIDEFDKTLKGLAQTQAKLNDEQAEAEKARDADELKRIAAAKQLNQQQIELIRNTVLLRDAQATLTASEQFIANAKQKQADLERKIANEVDFRGLRETEAIKRRLAGEEELKQRLLITRGILLESIDKLGALKPPKELTDQIRDIDQEIERLGKLTFTEQFNLAAKEFARIQDELQAKIAEVELAVRHRDLAEIEGRILVKKLNGEYVADLERQAELLRQIAERSGDQGLQKQATDAQATAREIRVATTETADFDKALRSVSIDALQEGFADFFRSLTDRTQTAQEKLLGLLDVVAGRIEDFIAQRFSEQLIESIFGTPGEQVGAGGGIIASIKRLFGFGGGGGEGATGGLGGAVAGAAGDAGAAATASAALTTGGTTAGAAMATGGATAGTALATGGVAFTTAITAAATGFTAAVVAAGAAFAAAVGAAAGTQAFSGLASGAGASVAATGMFPATPGGLVRIVEGGFDEAVLTTDPKHAAHQVRILREFLARTKGLYGRVQGFAEGGLISARNAELNMLASLPSRRSVVPVHAPELQLAGGEAAQTNVRILNLLDRRQLVGGHLRSAEGARDIMNVISENADEVGRRIRVR